MDNGEHHWESPEEEDLAARIAGFTPGAEPLQTVLRTDDRVLARVTDGIYRQPGSALRELISNAYDADATSVIIRTDRPRFGSIVVEDNGAGINPNALAHLLHHIGGSAKRSSAGAELGLTAVNDPLRSPGGRRLIGKIGIGLFSVSQLTQAFQIVTKTQGDGRRTVATVVMRQYSDAAAFDGTGDEKYEAGLVRIWREPASDTDSHGTTIILTDIRPQTRDTLRSEGIWAAIERNEAISDPDERQDLVPPDFHIGRLRPGTTSTLRVDNDAFDRLPWGRSDTAASAFRQLVDSVWAEAERGTPNPQLERIFDYYLQMVWQLSLAVPLPYVHGHPFDIPFSDSAYTFVIPASASGSPEEVYLAPDETIRSKLMLGDDTAGSPDFAVIIDDLDLRRPLKFTELPTTSHALKKPIIFVGQCRENFRGVPFELSSGPLEFQAYLMWTPKVVPTEDQGVLIRIHGSSGTLFDPTFFRYQVAEVTRLRQITCEIFVNEGLDSALNIDRESFNYAHPHVVYLTKWLHNVLRRVATVQKRLAAGVRSEARRTEDTAVQLQIASAVNEAWVEATGDEDVIPPTVSFSDARGQGLAGSYRFSRTKVLGASGAAHPSQRLRALEYQLQGIAQVLAAYGLLDQLDRREQENLLRAIREILETYA